MSVYISYIIKKKKKRDWFWSLFLIIYSKYHK